MKTVWEILIVVTLLGLFVLGATQLGEQVSTTQPLSQESYETLALYSDQTAAFVDEYEQEWNSSNIDPYKETDISKIDAFVQEYRNQKDRIDQIQGGLLLIYKAPDLIIWIIPVITVDDMGAYINAYRFGIWILVMLVFLAALKNGNYLPNF